MKDRFAAIVPMRHDSERVKGKNYRRFGDRPLFFHIIEALLACEQIGETVIDTDSPTIRDEALRTFPGLRVIDRPQHLRGGNVPMNEVLLNDVQEVDADFYLQTHSTNPLLRSATISSAINLFLEEQAKHDSLFGVTRLQTRLWNDQGKPLNHDLGILLRTQDLPPVYEENSCLYIFSKAVLERRHNRIGETPILFEIARDEAQDIDEEIDFEIAEFLWSRRASA